MPRPRTITSSPTPARGRAGRRRSPGLRLRPPIDGDRDRATSGRAVAELARAIVAPAIDCACAGDPAGVVFTCGNGAEAQASGHGDRRGAARSRPVAELACVVVTPTEGRAPDRDSASVVVAWCDGAEREGTRHGDRSRTCRPSRAVAELAEKIFSPTVPLAAWCPAARMDRARCEVAPVPCSRHSDREGAAVVGPTRGMRTRSETRFRTCPRLYAELTEGVRAPAVGLAKSRERAAVQASRRHRAEREPTRHSDRCESVCR